MNIKSSIRRDILSKRRSLSAQEQTVAGTGLAQQFASLAFDQPLSRVASYVPTKGEASPFEVIASITPDAVFLPVVTDASNGQMIFCEADLDLLASPGLLNGADVPRNKFGIAEPTISQTPQAPTTLDAVLVPLVAFTANGDRLGMGGGFYDRAFAFRIESAAPPLLIGLAYDFQYQETLDTEAWDVPMDVIITPQNSYRRRPA